MNIKDLSDEQLMLMFRYGNQNAFALLFEKHRGAVYGFSLRMLGRQHDAEDVCQEVFMRMAIAGKSYEPSARFKTWLFTIARNCCLNQIRQKRPVSIQMEHIEHRQTDNQEAAASETEATEVLEQAIAELPEQWREVFLLRFRNELEYQQISEVTQQPLGTVKTHIHRARLQLAKRMKNILGGKR